MISSKCQNGIIICNFVFCLIKNDFCEEKCDDFIERKLTWSIYNEHD